MPGMMNHLIGHLAKIPFFRIDPPNYQAMFSYMRWTPAPCNFVNLVLLAAYIWQNFGGVSPYFGATTDRRLYDIKAVLLFDIFFEESRKHEKKD
jgi:hypothetical protein